MDFNKQLHTIIFDDFKGLNLTNYHNFNDFKLLQIDDSLHPLENCIFFSNIIGMKRIVVDVGFGGGFPLLPLANCLNDIKFLGIEAKRKKVDAVNLIIKKLNLKNVQLIHQRVENIIFDLEIVIVVKAVSDINIFLKKISTRKKIFIFFYKGPNVDFKENYQDVLSSWELVENFSYQLDSFQRKFLGFSNKNVPCGTFSNREPILLSNILK